MTTFFILLACVSIVLGLFTVVLKKPVTIRISIIAFFVSITALIAFSTNSDKQEQSIASDDNSSAPVSPNPDFHEKRMGYRTYWNGVLTKIAIADTTLNLAIEALKQDDTIQASGLLKQGEDYADSARSAAWDNVPDGWDEESTKLASAASFLGDALKNARSYLDDSLPSEIADASSSKNQAASVLDAVTHDARISYIAMGGQWSDLDDEEKDKKAVSEVVHMFAHLSSDTGNQANSQ